MHSLHNYLPSERFSATVFFLVTIEPQYYRASPYDVRLIRDLFMSPPPPLPL